MPAASASFCASHAAAKPMIGQHVAGQLHAGTGSGLACADHHRRPLLENRFDQFVGVVVRPDHDGQLTLVRSAGSAADGSIDDVDTLGPQLIGEFGGGAGLDRGVDRDDRTGLGVLGELAYHVANLRVVEHRDADDVGLRDVGHAVGQRRTELG